jgi:hypothetical protein
VEPVEREGKKSELGGCGGPLGEDRFRSFLGFFLFCGVSSKLQNAPLLFELCTSIYR